MKTLKYIKFAFLLILFGSCTLSDFKDMNVDKKTASQAIPSYMLTNAIRYIPEALLMSNEPQVSFWMQYWNQIPYVSHEIYNFTEVGFPFYQSVLVNLQYIINQNTDPATKEKMISYGDNNNQVAISRILKAYYFLSLTDRWGDVPYFDALKGDKGGDYLRAKVDKQKDIYYDLFKELTEAVNQVDENAIVSVKGDILFKGDMRKWKKFANTTRLIMALRISNVDPEKGKTEFNLAQNASAGIIESNDENLEYPFINDDLGNNYNYMYNWNNSSSYPYAMCKTLIDYMKNLNDPRLPYYADKATATNDYVGQPVASIGEQSKFSRMGINMRQKETPMYIYSYAQVLFSLSEGVVRGWTSGDAESYYNNAIKSSMIQYNVYNPVSYSDFINQSDVKYDAATPYKMIGNQKWVALYPYGHEAWAEWRRLGYPVLIPPVGAVTPDGQIPRRFVYSISMKNLMPDQFAEVEKRQPDKPNTHIWWDVK